QCFFQGDKYLITTIEKKPEYRGKKSTDLKMLTTDPTTDLIRPKI
ncbi:18027_t:CDS:1, partial [Rhizophagus irregularis]